MLKGDHASVTPVRTSRALSSYSKCAQIDVPLAAPAGVMIVRDVVDRSRCNCACGCSCARAMRIQSAVIQRNQALAHRRHSVDVLHFSKDHDFLSGELQGADSPRVRNSV